MPSAPSLTPLNESEESPEEEDFSTELLRTILRHQFIDFRHMSRPMRTIIGFGIVNIGIAVLIITSNAFIHLPEVSIGNSNIPVSALVYTLLLLPLSICMFTAGALYARSSVKILTIFFFMIFSYILLPLREILTLPDNQQAFLRILFGAANVLMIGWSLLMWILDQRAARLQRDTYAHRKHMVWATIWIISSIIILYFIGCFGIYVIHNASQYGLANIQALIETIGVLLIPIYVITGSDYAMWGEVIGGQFIKWARPRQTHTIFALLICCTCLLLLAVDIFLGTQSVAPGYVLRTLWIGLLFGPLFAFLGFCGVRFFVWLGHIDTWPHTRVPFGILVTSVFVGFVFQLLYQFTNSLFAIGFLGFVTIICILLLFLGRFPLPKRSHSNQRYLATSGLFILIVLWIGEIGVLPFGIQNIFLNNVLEFNVVLSFAILGFLGTLWITRRINPMSNGLLASLLSLSVGIALLTILFDTVNKGLIFQDSLIFLPALFFVFALGWDNTSGEHYLNRKTPDNFPVLRECSRLSGISALSPF